MMNPPAINGFGRYLWAMTGLERWYLEIQITNEFSSMKIYRLGGGGTYANLFDAHPPFRLTATLDGPPVSPKAELNVIEVNEYDFETVAGTLFTLVNLKEL